MNLNKLDLNLVLIFLAVYRTRSATLAGLELELTQPAVSVGLKRLRTHLGDPLFVKTSQGMTPTPLAERMAGPLQEAMDLMSRSLEESQRFDPAASHRAFNIYAGDMGQMVLMPRLVGVLQREAPNARINVLEVTPREAQLLMAEGGLDIAIGAFPAFDGNFHSQRLFKKQYVVMARRDHPALQGGLTLERFLQARHAVFHPPGGGQEEFEAWLDAFFKQQGATRRVVVELAHGLGVAETIAANELLICVPQRLATTGVAEQSLTYVPLPFDYPSVDICQFWHHRMHGDAGHQWLRSHVYRKYFGFEQDGAAAS